MKYVYKVWSDNFFGDFLSVDAYEVVMLHMSTSDYTLHRSSIVSANDIPPMAEILCYDTDADQWFTASTQEISA